MKRRMPSKGIKMKLRINPTGTNTPEGRLGYRGYIEDITAYQNA